MNIFTKIEEIKTIPQNIKTEVKTPAPGDVIRDPLKKKDDFYPEMVIIPAGSFRMGDIQGGGSSDELPVHEVSVGQFAMGKGVVA